MNLLLFVKQTSTQQGTNTDIATFHVRKCEDHNNGKCFNRD